MVILKTGMLLLLSLFVTACATGKNNFVAAVPTQEKGSVVYLYRTHSTANVLLTPEFSIDGSKNISMDNGEYRMLYLAPGMHRLSLQAIEGYTPAQQLTLKVDADSVHYLRLDSFIQFESGLRYRTYKRAFALREVDAGTASSEIALCRDADAVAAKQQPAAGGNNAVDSQRSETQFSTDKTANPFSR